MSIKDSVKNIKSAFKELGIELQEKEIEEKLNLLVNNYHVPLKEAERTTRSALGKTYNVIDKIKVGGGMRGPSEMIAIGDIPIKDNDWYSIKGKIVQLWDSNSESVSQTGLIGDETGVVKFTVFAKSEVPDILEEDEVYEIQNVVTSIWQGKVSVKLNKSTVIKHLMGETMETGRQTVEIAGFISQILAGSGLIKRCPEPKCRRKLVKGQCSEHGVVEGVYDIRIKALLEDSEVLAVPVCQDLIINREAIEASLGVTLDQAKEMAMATLDADTVAAEFGKKILGKYVTLQGSKLDTNFLVTEIAVEA